MKFSIFNFQFSKIRLAITLGVWLAAAGGAMAKKDSRVEVTTNGLRLLTGSTLRIEAVVKDNGSGAGLANKKIVFGYDQGWSYAEYLTTDGQGRAVWNLQLNNREWETGFCGGGGSQNVPCRYQAQIYFMGDSEYRGAMAKAYFETTSVSSKVEATPQTARGVSGDFGIPSENRPAPAIYWMWDQCVYDPSSAPNVPVSGECPGRDGRNYGAFGSEYYERWKDLSYDRIRQRLAIGDSRRIRVWGEDGRPTMVPQPIIMGVTTHESDPRAGGNQAPGRLGKITLASGVEAINWCGDEWVNGYKAMVRGLAAEFDSKPAGQRPAAIMMSVGYDSEAVPWKGSQAEIDEVQNYCRSRSRSGNGADGFQNLLIELAEYHLQQFRNIPIYVQGNPYAMTNEVIARVGANPANGGREYGGKSNGWTGSWGQWTYASMGDAEGESGLYYKNFELMKAFESKVGADSSGLGFIETRHGIYSGTYWMLLGMLAHRADWIGFHSDHWGAFDKNRAMPWLNDFVTSHLGKNVENTPSVWTVMREIQVPNKKENWGWPAPGKVWGSGVYGDYNFFMYRRDNIAGNRAIKVTQAEIPGVWGNKDIPGSSTLAKAQAYTNGATMLYFDYNRNGNYRDDAENGSTIGTARRTDIASGNRYMSFDIDNGWKWAGLRPSQNAGLKYKVVVIYLNRGTDNFYIEYKNEAGQLVRKEIRKGPITNIPETDSGPQTNWVDKWVRYTTEVTDAYFNDQLEGQTDIRINAGDSGDEIIQLVEVQNSLLYPDGEVIPSGYPTRVPTATPTNGPSPTPTVAPPTPTSYQGGRQLECQGVCFSRETSCGSYCGGYSVAGYGCFPLTGEALDRQPICATTPLTETRYLCCREVGPTAMPTRVTPTVGPGACQCANGGVPARSRGNANCDAVVDMIDFQTWMTEFAGQSAVKTSDFNCDGRVDMMDFAVWLGEFGRR